MVKYLLYAGGFLVSFVLVFLAVYGLITFVYFPAGAQKDEAVRNAQGRLASYSNAPDSLGAESIVPQDSSGQTTQKVVNDELVTELSLAQIDTLVSMLRGSDAYLKQVRESATVKLDTTVVDQMIAAEVRKRERIIDSLRTTLDSLQQSLAKLSPSSSSSPEEYKKLAKIYEVMEPASAASVLNGLGDQAAAAILERMKQRQAAEILAALSPEQAAKLSKMIVKKND